MDEQKKQKVLIGVVAVAALGAGGFWFAGRDTGGDTTAAVKSTTTGRKQRTKKLSTGSKLERKARAPRSTAKKEIKRRERAEVDRKTTSRKKRSRRDRKSVKKESMVPAA